MGFFTHVFKHNSDVIEMSFSIRIMREFLTIKLVGVPRSLPPPPLGITLTDITAITLGLVSIGTHSIKACVPFLPWRWMDTHSIKGPA